MPRKQMRIDITIPEAKKAARDLREVSRAEEMVAKNAIGAAGGMDRMRISTAGARRQLGAIRNNLLLVTFAFGGAAFALKKMIDMAGDAAEIYSKFSAVFKEHTEVTEEWAESFGQAVGRARTDLLEWLSTLQDTFVPLGFARGEAAELSKRLVQLAVDVASFNNQADPDVIRDFQSALVGNHETVRKYGIVITEAGLKQEALSSGIIESKRELTSLEKVQTRLNILFAGTADAQGDAIRTADSFNNRVKAMQAEFKALSEEIGDRFIPVAGKAVEGITGMTSSMREFLDMLFGPKPENILKDLEAAGLTDKEMLNLLGESLETLRERQKNLLLDMAGLSIFITPTIQAYAEAFQILAERMSAATLAQFDQKESLKSLVEETAKWLAQQKEARDLMPDLGGAEKETEKRMAENRKRIKEIEREWKRALSPAIAMSRNLSTALLTAGDAGVSTANAFHDAWHRSLRAIIAEIIANAAILALASIFFPGTGLVKKSGGLLSALLGGIKFAQHGMNQVVTQPTVIIAGERGPEHVQITPEARPSPMPGGDTYNIYLTAPIPEDWARNELVPLLARVQS